MKHELVTLQREVVEQVLEALIYYISSEDQRFQAAIALRAALDHQQGEQEPFAWISPRALEWGTRQSEKVVKLTCKAQPEYDFTEPLYTHPQPQVEQEPVGFVRQIDIEQIAKTPSDWGVMFGEVMGFNTVPVYTHPQPKREPLTDEEIDKLCPQFDDPMRREMWIIGFKAAHGIK